MVYGYQFMVIWLSILCYFFKYISVTVRKFKYNRTDPRKTINAILLFQ